MPTLPETLDQLNIIPLDALLLGIFLTAAIILVIRDWRLLILALLGQYIVTTLIISRLVRPDIAAVKLLIGAFICPILFLSVRQVIAFTPTVVTNIETTIDRRKNLGWWNNFVEAVLPFIFGRKRHRGLTSTGLLFRFFAALLMMIVAILLSQTLSLSNDLSQEFEIAIYWLILAGLTALILFEDPLKVGLGLFTLFMGFDLYYVTVEASLFLTGLWGTVNLLVALVTGYLIVAKGANPEEGR